MLMALLLSLTQRQRTWCPGLHLKLVSTLIISKFKFKKIILGYSGMNTHTGLYVLSKIMKNFIGVMSEEARTISDTDGELCYTYTRTHTHTHTHTLHVLYMCSACEVHVLTIIHYWIVLASRRLAGVLA